MDKRTPAPALPVVPEKAPVDTRPAGDALDRDSIVNELGCGPEPIGLRSDFNSGE